MKTLLLTLVMMMAVGVGCNSDTSAPEKQTDEEKDIVESACLKDHPPGSIDQAVHDIFAKAAPDIVESACLKHHCPGSIEQLVCTIVAEEAGRWIPSQKSVPNQVLGEEDAPVVSEAKTQDSE